MAIRTIPRAVPLRALRVLCLVLVLAARPLAAGEDVSYRVVRDVTYVRRAEEGQTADLYLPRGTGPFPGVLMVHGGAWMAGNKHHPAWHARRLAQRGFAVMSINYRLAPRHPFPAQLEDCRAALRWMVQQAGTYPWDPQRLAGYGYSAGGHLVCLLGMIESQGRGEGLNAPAGVASGSPEFQAPSAQCSGRRAPADAAERPPLGASLRAIVAGGAPCDFSDEPLDSERLVFWLGATRADRPDLYQQASPTSFVSPTAPPVFLFHGAQDRVVPLANADRLRARLQDQGVEAHLYVVSQAGHLATYLNQQAFERSVQFLDRNLRTLSQE